MSAWYNEFMNNVTYTLHIERAEEGGYVAFFPALPGCHTQGETLEEVIAMAKDALAGYLDCLRTNGDPIPKEKTKSPQTSFDVPLSMSFA
jgi:predicted RNase H-like HicB family nuclease